MFKNTLNAVVLAGVVSVMPAPATGETTRQDQQVRGKDQNSISNFAPAKPKLDLRTTVVEKSPRHKSQTAVFSLPVESGNSKQCVATGALLWNSSPAAIVLCVLAVCFVCAAVGLI